MGLKYDPLFNANMVLQIASVILPSSRIGWTFSSETTENDVKKIFTVFGIMTRMKVPQYSSSGDIQPDGGGHENCINI